MLTRPISSARIQCCKFHQLLHNQFTPSTWNGISLSCVPWPSSGWLSGVNL